MPRIDILLKPINAFSSICLFKKYDSAETIFCDAPGHCPRNNYYDKIERHRVRHVRPLVWLSSDLAGNFTVATRY